MLNGLLPGGEEPTPKRRLSPQEMIEWNGFLDHLKTRGVQGSKILDKKDHNLGEQLFNEYKQSNPNISIDYSIVPIVQNEHNLFAQQAREFAKRKGDPNADKLYSDNSKVDGWLGSKTSQQYFVPATLKTITNGAAKEQPLGLMNGNLIPTTSKTPPKGVAIEKLQDGYYYQDPQSGDMVRVK